MGDADTQDASEGIAKGVEGKGMSKVQLGTKLFESSLIAVLEAEGKKATKVWLNGASPIDGAFLVPLPLEEVIEALRLARFQEAAEDLAQLSQEEEEAVRNGETG
jgi:hypothetical protein